MPLFDDLHAGSVHHHMNHVPKHVPGENPIWIGLIAILAVTITIVAVMKVAKAEKENSPELLQKHR
eukprot:CAMPEP_0116834384 /NCGR_PEP_ID=MMETSP0418-20121206/6961_1 /TAXON_ID=1158023 /ORGANISM="Astrosyne radiata, Strain 13vi08-1A" /LENGTH=65 /DNA_ID=CAMNT_0004463937 /DNA_START=112 /DNA_END=312 /DNA_ORIENTATION=+